MTLKRTLLNNKICLLLIVLCASFAARAAEFTQTVCRDGGQIGITQTPAGQVWNPAPVTISDQFFGLTPVEALRDVYITGSLKINDRRRKAYSDNWQLEIVYDIKLYNNANTLVQTLSNEKLSVNYFKNGPYDDYVEKIYRSGVNYRKAVVTITQINAQQLDDAGSVLSTYTLQSLDNSMFDDVSMEWRCTSVRYFQMSTGSALSINHSSGTQVNLSPVCPGNTPNNIIRLGWSYLQGAESYDVEWLFLDIPPTLNSSTNSYVLPTLSQNFPVDWRRATRVNVTGNFYDIPLLYPTGIVIYRVRGVGVDISNNLVRLEGRWSRTPGSGGYLDNLSGITDAFVYCGMETGLNWTSGLSFAEEGKNKGVVSFADGTGRTRQTVTTVSTDENTLVAEPSLDNMGRTSVQFLPVPVRGEQFHYFPKFNEGYEAGVYDISSAFPNNLPVPGLAGTSAAVQKFYSSSNPFLSSSGSAYDNYLARISAYLPDAENYPFIQTRMMNDGSGRVHSSSGVGGKHMLGGGHDTRYFYATPGAQAELDRLFGSEVGFVSYYTKNMTVDPNGQTSISYVDGYGRTVATALAGTNTDKQLESIDNNILTPIEADLLVNNTLLGNGTLTASKDFLVPVDGLYDFSYSVSADEFTSLCSGTYDCKLEFLITVKTDEGNEKIQPTPVWRSVSSTAFPYTFSLMLQTGKYTVTKSLRIKDSQFQRILADVNNDLGSDWETTTNACFTPPFESGCISCETQCENAYKYSYTHSNGQTYWIYRNIGAPGLDYTTDPVVAGVTDGNNNPVFTLISTGDSVVIRAEAAILACKDLCNTIPTVNTGTECEMKRILLIRDVLPDGQYFENRPKDPTVSGLPNPDYTTGPDSDPDSRNAWLEAYAYDLKSSFGALLNPSAPSASWNDIRTGWSGINQTQPAFETLKDQLVTRHPEYCLWKAFCGNGDDSCDCKPNQPSFYGTPTHYADVMVNTITDNAAAAGQLFMPTGHHPVIVGYQTGPLNAGYYLPELAPDPCKNDPLVYCHPELADSLYRLLTNYMPITVNSTPVNISIWYLLEDPENLRAHNLTSGSHPTYPDAFVQYIQILHGSPANPSGGVLSPGNPNAVTKWQFFRNVYGFFRQSIQYNLAAAEAQTCMTTSTPVHPLAADLNACGPGVACPKLPFFSAWDNDDDGYMDLGGGPAGFSFDGMQIRYPYINLFAGGANPAADYCETNCSALATQWISQLETGIRSCVTLSTDANTGNPIMPSFQIPAADKLILRDYFSNICEKSCSTQNATNVYTHDYTSYSAMTAGDWIGSGYIFGPYYNGSTVISTVNDVVTRYTELHPAAQGCPVIINSIPASSGQPSPDPNTLNCACQSFADLILENGGLKPPYQQINPVKWPLTGAASGSVFDMAHIRQALLDMESLPAAYATLIQGLSNNQFRDLVLHWLNACDQNSAGTIPTFVDGSTNVDFPEILACASDTALPGEMTCAQMEAEQEQNVNSAAFALFKQTQLELFETGYKAGCLAYAKPTEIFTMSYKLSEYHYTLYYYDQAGNLVKTVPPAGVSIIVNPTTLSTINSFRLAHHHDADYADQSGFYRPKHKKISNYVYNGQNQIIEQTTPDGGTSTFYYDALGRLAASQHAQQYTDDVHSYTQYDSRGRIAEVGQIDRLSFFIPGDRKKNQKFIEQFPTTPGDLTPFEFILANNEPKKAQITKTFYDEAIFWQWGVPATAFPQTNLRNRVSTTVYYAVFPVNGWAYYDNAVHYTYDIHGNVNRLAQDIPALQDAKRRFLYTDYVYDLISGNVNEVHYMKGYPEQFSHYYRYDADNRLTIARTSKNGGLIKESEAKYFYYPTGALARTELGRAQVQGMDHAYSIHGWVKGVNTDEINTLADIGNDARNDVNNLHAFFGVDAAGYTLGYYHGDYIGIGSPTPFEADVVQSDDMAQAMHPGTSALADWGLYNGNIAKMVSAGLDCEEKLMEVLGRSFLYDQLNRITRSGAFVRNNEVDFQNTFPSFTWNGVSAANRWDTRYKYDPDGNITDLWRLDGAGNLMDDLSYKYIGSTNRLDHVEDPIPASVRPDDIDMQGSGNYSYDAIGNLRMDNSEDIDHIAWNVYGKMKYIRRVPGRGKSDLWFGYNPAGQRIVKVNKASDLTSPESGYSATFYALDAQGNPLALYELEENVEAAKYELTCSDQMIYGSSRIGMFHRKQKICSGCNVDLKALENSRYSTAPPQNYAAPAPMNGSAAPKATLGTREYEFNNHLGNVLATVADRKVFDPTNDVIGSGDGAVVFQYRPEVLTAGDYYPFGAPLPGRGCSKPLDCTISSTVIEEWVFTDPFIRDVTPVRAADLDFTPLYVSARTYAPEDGAAYIFSADEGAHRIEFDVDIMAVTGDAKLGVRVLGYDPVTGDHTDLVAEIDEVQDLTESISFYSNAPRTYKFLLEQKNIGSLTFWWKKFLVKRVREVFTRNCNGTPEGYRYGFNGKEDDKETVSTGEGTQNYGMRIYNPALGRFLSVDPIARNYPMLTPYQFGSNRPIMYIDLDGLEGTTPNANGKTDSQILQENGNVVTTTDQNPKSTTQRPPNHVSASSIQPLDLASLSGTPQQMGKQITDHLYKVIEYQISDPSSDLMLAGSIPMSSIFSNIGTSNFPLNTPVNTTYESSPGNEINVQLSLNGLTGNATEGITLGTINFQAATTGNNIANQTTVNHPTNFGGNITMVATGSSIIRGGQTQIVRPDAARLAVQVGSRYNHGFILRDKIQIWAEKVPAMYPLAPPNRNFSGFQIGTRVTPNLNAATDGDFTK